MSTRALLVRIGALGDTIMAFSAARAVAEASGDVVDVLGRAPWTADCVRHMPWIGTVREWQGRSRPYWFAPEQWRLAAWLRQRRGPIMVMDHDARVQALIRRTAQATRVCWRQDVTRLSDEHQVAAAHRQCGQALGKTLTVHAPEVRLDADERARASQLLAREGVNGPYMCLQLGSSRTTRAGDPARATDRWWAAENWLTVATALRARHPGVRFVLTGAGAEAQWLPAIANQIGADAIVVAGKTTLRELFAVLAGALGTVSCDTGTAHAAAALGCPLVVLFGPTDPRITGPWPGWNPTAPSATVRIVTGPPNATILSGEKNWAAYHRMDAISPAAVLAAWAEVVAHE